MYCKKCKTKMRVYQLKDHKELHSCPRCGYTLVADTDAPYISGPYGEMHIENFQEAMNETGIISYAQ